MIAGVALIRADNVVLNVAMISTFHLDGEKLYVHYAGGRIWSFVGQQREVIWGKLREVSQDLMEHRTPAGAGV